VERKDWEGKSMKERVRRKDWEGKTGKERVRRKEEGKSGKEGL
jgi:hypothetical protein